jgi:hypothetical protein
MSEDRGPILVKAAVSREEVSEGVRVDGVVFGEGRLSVEVGEEVLRTMGESTEETREKLNKFVNSMNTKIQSVPSPMPRRLDMSM